MSHLDYAIQKVGLSKNAPRIYKQGKALAEAGFTPGTTYSTLVDETKGMVLVKIDPNGTKVVSAKGEESKRVPVIDLNSHETLGIFAGMDQVRVIVRQGVIYLLALASEMRRKERLERLHKTLDAGDPILIGSVSHGAGILSRAIHEGLSDTGHSVKLAFANDIEPEYLDQAQRANDIWDEDTVRIEAPLQEAAFDSWLTEQLPKVHILEGGIPCTASSNAGRAKKHLAKPEDDPNVGHLMVPFLTLIARINPVIVTLENVENYANTASMALFRTTMKDFGYEVHERILEGSQFGALENRKRLAAVAVTKGIQFDFDALALPPTLVKKVGDILDDVALDDPSWSPMSYLKEKEVSDAAAGKGFKMQPVPCDATRIPTITSGYMKRRSTDPFVQHPVNPDLLRLFTPQEHCRAKGIPETLIQGLSATRAHQVLGQSICYAAFRHVGKLIGLAIKQLTPSQSLTALAA